jgi:hypothetical protein
LLRPVIKYPFFFYESFVFFSFWNPILINEIVFPLP